MNKKPQLGMICSQAFGVHGVEVMPSQCLLSDAVSGRGVGLWERWASTFLLAFFARKLAVAEGEREQKAPAE